MQRSSDARPRALGVCCAVAHRAALTLGHAALVPTVRPTPLHPAPPRSDMQGGGNPMRPHRARLTKTLIDGYGLNNKMQIMRMPQQQKEDILLFHADGGWRWMGRGGVG